MHYVIAVDQTILVEDLESILQAHLPEDDAEVRDVAAKTQKGGADKYAEINEHRSHWKFIPGFGWLLSLHRPFVFVESGLRPFVTALLRIFRCHQDLMRTTPIFS